MSEKFDEKVIMAAIIEHATQVQCDVMELKFLRQLVQDELREREFLLVLEDCHTEHTRFWRNVNEVLNFSAKRSAIILTTKCGDSAKRCFPRQNRRTPHFYDLSPLRDEHCLQILQQLACRCDGPGPGSDHGLMRIISGNVLYHCGGNPLYVKAICGLLCHAKRVLQQLGNLKEVFAPDLKLCCDILPQHLKLCLTLCSLFPKDFVFKRHHLIRLWMSQGFINGEGFGKPEEIATEYFNELICRSFFEHSPLHDKKEDKFVMPKLFHDMMTSISKDACLLCEHLLRSIPEKIRYLSIVPWERRTVVTLHPITKHVRNLDAFMVVNRSELKNSSMSSPFLKLEGLCDFLLKFKSLRTLNLSYTVIGQLPASVGNLKNLQYLAVNNTDIRRLPSELCLLENLQTLEARDCPQLVTLPEDTKYLAKLRHLDVRKQPGHVRMPIGVGQLMHLQSLPVFHVGEGLSDCSIQELRNLDDLHGDLAISGLENIKVINDAKVAKLISKKHLETLTLEWSGSSIYFEDDDGDISAEVFESLQPPHDLENLIVQNYSGSIFPEWIGKSPYDNLQSITLDNCYNCNLLPALGDLLSLKYLCIRKMYALKTFACTASLSEERSGGKFRALELLKLWEMYELDSWMVKAGDFPHLHTVSICGCPRLKSLPHFPSLVNLSFHHCNQLPEIQELLNLESLKIEGFHDTVSLDLPQGLPALKNLEISRCNNLESVAGLSKLSSVERLKIVKCPKLDVVNTWQQYHFNKISTTRYAGLKENPHLFSNYKFSL
jgi:Leucine-rich repeat (LRR) protein